jgi:hypothetical protein
MSSMKHPRFEVVLIAAGFFLVSLVPVNGRTWTDAKGTSIEGEYVSSTAETVVIRRTTDGQVFRLKLSEISDEDRQTVAQKQAEEKQLNAINAVIKGEVVWRLPGWRSLGWSSTHPAEIWLWDDKTATPSEKVASVSVDYVKDRSHNQFSGKFKTDAPVAVPKNAKLVVKAQFTATVNNEKKDLEQISSPMSLPALNKGEIDLPTVRLSLMR